MPRISTIVSILNLERANARKNIIKLTAFKDHQIAYHIYKDPRPPQLPLQHEPCKGWHELSLELQCAQHVSDWLTRSVFAKCTPFCHCLMYLGCVQIRCRKVGRPPIKSHHKHFHLIRWIAGLVKRIKLEGNKLNFKWDFMIDAMYHYYLCGINNQLLPMYSMNHKSCMWKNRALSEAKKVLRSSCGSLSCFIIPRINAVWVRLE